MATPGCFLGPFAWKICFPYFYSYVVSVFVTEAHFLRQYIAGSCLCIHSVSLCLFIGELAPLMLRDTKEKWLLLHSIFVVRDGFVCIFCVCWKKINFLLFLWCSFLPSVGIFHLLSFVERYCINMFLLCNILVFP